MELTLEQALQKGIEAHKAGKAQEADRYYTAILKAQPKHSDANHNMGVLAVGLGKVETALSFFKTALETNPSVAQYWLSYINALVKLDRIAAAEAVLEQAKSRGVRGDGFEKIEKRLGSATSKNSNAQEPSQDQLQSLINSHKQEQYQETLDEAKKLLKKFPESINLLNIIGAANKGLGRLDAAVEAYIKALDFKNDYVAAYNNLGIILRDQGKIEEALQTLNKGLSFEPNSAVISNNIGNVLKDKGQLKEAIESYKKALSINPDYAEAHNNMGLALQDNGKLQEALESYNKALSVKPDYAAAYNNIGNVFKDEGKLKDAVDSYKKALSINPNYATAYKNMGNALQDMGDLDEAIESYNKALSINPDDGSAKHMLFALTGNTNETAPREYVENLFDAYSRKFESSLVDKLQYKIPKLIRDILIKPNSNDTLGSILDLGCGTGLLGLEIKNHCSILEGIDLSNKMLAIAKQKNLYDKLIHSDIVEYLSTHSLDFDYYIALDVFIYLGELSEIFRLIKSRNKKPGKLVFSTEHTKKDGYHLLKSGRYSHSKSYIECLCKKFDYNISHFSTTNLRKEHGNFIRGGIYTVSF